MNELSTDRAYSILFIADYEKASLKWKQFVDTIVNNLLNKPAVVGGTWMKFSNLPPITVSVVNRAETKEQAFTSLKESKYDVVIVNNRLEGTPIGGGMLKRFRQYHPDALFIPLLDISQKRGSTKRDGSICNGDGLLNIFNSGFYNGLYKNCINMGTMIKIIRAGGRPREVAYAYYGFEQALVDGSNEPTTSETPSNSPAGESVSIAGEVDVTKVNDESKNETKENYVERGQDGTTGKKHSQEREEIKQEGKNKPLNRRERRRQERERQERENEQLISEKEDRQIEQKGIQQLSPVYLEENNESGNGEISAYSDNPQLNEMMEMMKRRGQMNSDVVVPGALYGKVVFAKGSMVMVDLEKSLEQVGLNFADIFNVPVVIPYTKFGDLQ